MVTLLEAARNSEKTFRESLISTSNKTTPLISDCILRYKKDRYSVFDIIKNAPRLHENPILRDTKGDVSGNNNTFELRGESFLTKAEIQEFYDKGYIAKKYKFLNFSDEDIQNVKKEYVEYKNRCQSGMYDQVYCKLPDYVAHLYLPSVVKLLKDNYDDIVQKSISIFNMPEEELFFEVGVFLIDETKKGINVHQDYAYYLLDQTSKDIKTSLITFHTAISDKGLTRLNLFTGTHKEILHNLTSLRCLMDQNIKIDEDLAMYSGCISEYVINTNQLPYDGYGSEVLTLSHISRYPQQLYILDKYKDNDVEGYEVDTNPGEFVIFDPATLHSNGASSGNIDELIESLERNITDDNISRLSLAVRVMHTKNSKDHFLWMAAREKIEVLQKFFDDRCNDNKNLSPNIKDKVELKKNINEFYTVLSNNKLCSPDSPYLSIDEIYDLHAQSGAYTEGRMERL